MQRMGMVIGIAPEHIAECKALHADAWPEILAGLTAANVTNYSTFLRETENLLFGYCGYVGSDFAADVQTIGEGGDQALVGALHALPAAARAPR